MFSVPTLAELLAEPNKVRDIPLEAVPALRAELARLDSMLITRLFASVLSHNDNGPQNDRLLTADEAAQKLAVSKDYLYRKSRKGRLPFAVRVGKSSVRFSEVGIERYIRSKSGQ